MSWLGGRRLTPADLGAEGNAFTLLRWVLASSVMFSHAWNLTQLSLDPSVALFGRPLSQLAVFLFFSLSGFLVTGSLVKRGVRDFGVARLLRLVPGLWIMLLVVTLGLGALVGTLPFTDYLANHQTWRYLAINGSLVAAEYRLPGVFEQLPNVGVNGSLWTIPQEVRCYIALAVLGAVGALRSRRWLLAALIVGVLVQLVVPGDIIPALEQPRRLAMSFFLGVVAWQWRFALRWSWPVALVAAAVSIGLAQLALPPGIPMVAQQVALAYLAGVAAFRSPSVVTRFSRRLPDYSYGIYIYAFPAQQLALATGYGATPLANLMAGLALTLPLAALSWHLVEQPALGLKTRFTKVRADKVSDNFTTSDRTIRAELDNTAT